MASSGDTFAAFPMNQPFIHLASGSPRRRELLAQIGVPFRPCPVDIDESRAPRETPADYVRRVSLDKAREASRRVADGAPVLAADTAVVIEGEALGKPRDRDDALAMLARLSDREHEVLTAVVVLHAGEEHHALSASRVRFRRTTGAEREAYWLTGEPRDKAGAYAIQGRGALFVASLNGSYSGVMGLPLYETAALLQRCGFALLA